MNQIRRRDFLKYTALGSGYLMASNMLWAKKQGGPKPNIIFILTDQQSASMMSCAGNGWLKTPAMDSIGENGIRFTRAYTTNPVCSPARVGFMTGRFPGAFNDNKGRQARENRGSASTPSVSQEVKDTTIAAYLKQAGYDLVYGGKEHLPDPLQPTVLGFKDITDDERQKLAEKASEFITAKNDKPYFLMLSFINPHDICYMALRDAQPPDKQQQLNRRRECKVLDEALQMPEGVTEEAFFENYCPPLPDNYEPQQDEPKAIGSLLGRRTFRRLARENYSDQRWRQHRWAYCRLTERVDRQIQMVLDAVKAAGQEENTLILFSSDHGDMDAAHRMEHKTTLYEESANIPFMAMWKGHIRPGQVDKTHLVSNGLDLLPTVCDYAGIKDAVADPRGRSLRPLFEGRDVPWRDTLGVESEIGRMVVDEDGFKFIQYDAVGIEEQLLDLNEDPGEATHFTNDPKYASKLAELKRSFETEWFPNLPKM